MLWDCEALILPLVGNRYQARHAYPMTSAGTKIVLSTRREFIRIAGAQGWKQLGQARCNTRLNLLQFRENLASETLLQISTFFTVNLSAITMKERQLIARTES